MPWTAPMTAVAGAVWTAAQWNVHVRDNLNMCAPAVATGGSRWIVAAGWNTVAEREPQVRFIGTAETTDSTSYTDLPTIGPTVTTTTAGRAIVAISSRISNSTAGLGGRISVEVSGASSISASDLNCVCAESGNGGDQFKLSWFTMFDEGLDPGENTFQLKYRATGGGIATFSSRGLVVISF